MTTNPLVANVKSSTTWHTALGPVDDFASAADAAGKGNWVSAGLDSGLGALDTLGAVADPLGALISAGVGWVIEHLEPFPTWMDHLAGSPDEINSFAQTWHNVGQRIHQDADQFRSTVASDTSPWSGAAVEVYRAATSAQAEVIDGFGTMCTGIADCVQLGGAIVGAVRSMVEEALSQIVGYGLSKLVELLSVVLTGKAIAEIVAKVSEWAGKIGKFVKDLLESMGRLGEILGKVGEGVADASSKVKEIADAFADLPINEGPLSEGRALPSAEHVVYQVDRAEGQSAAHTADTGNYQP